MKAINIQNIKGSEKVKILPHKSKRQERQVNIEITNPTSIAQEVKQNWGQQIQIIDPNTAK